LKNEGKDVVKPDNSSLSCRSVLQEWLKLNIVTERLNFLCCCSVCLLLLVPRKRS